MNDKWNLITPTNKFTDLKIDQSKKKTNLMEEEEEYKSKKEIGEKLYERKKRTYDEMETRSKRGFTPAIQNLPTFGDNLTIRNLDKISNLPLDIKPQSLKTQSIINGNIESIKTNKLESLKILANESIEKFLFMDEKLIDTDRNIGSSQINSYFNKKLNSDFLIKNKTKYPDILFNIFNNDREAKFSFSGLYIPLNILYFVRDNQIYLWDFQINEIYTYKEISNVIVNLHITLPKAGVFSPEVSYIMIIATTNEIFLILIIINQENKRLTFIKSDFVYDAHDITTSICSTSERRVFLGSQNNYMYELDYTNQYSFFGFNKRAKKITHSSQSFFNKIIPDVFNFKKYSYMSKLVVDNTRHLLYSLVYFTRNETTTFNSDLVLDSLVQVYDLGIDGQGFKKVGEITQTNIKERFYFLSNQPMRKESGFIILDIFPLNLSESKYYHLLIVTKNGIRAYISFDMFSSNLILKEEEKILNYDKNKIYRMRPSEKFTIILKQIPEPSNATIIEGNEYDPTLRALQKSFIYNQIFYIDKKLFIFYKDDFKKRSFIDVVEYEESDWIKSQDQFTNLTINRSKEIISNILKLEINKEIYTIMKIPQSQRDSNFLFNSELMKLIEYDNIIPKNLNFLDSNEHLSYTCMHSYSKQIFLKPDEIIIMTSSELITVSKLRPIDTLFKILVSNPEINEEIFSFISDHGINETFFMLLTIFSNRNFIFFKKIEEISIHNDSFQSNPNYSNMLLMHSSEIRNDQKTIETAQTYFIKLIEFSIRGLNLDVDKKLEKVKTIETNLIGQFAEDIHTQRINFIHYALFMYLARIARLFWEEKLYNQSLNENELIIETMKINHLKYLQSLLIEFQDKLKDMREKVIQKSLEVDMKLKTHNLNIYDFSNISMEIDEVLYLSEKFIETLQFVEFLYELSPIKKHLLKLPKNLVKEMTNLKFKDIILNSNMPILKQWLEEYFEVALNENDYYKVGLKLDELCQMCPNILSKNDKEVITANMLMRLSKSKKDDEISKKNLVRKAVNLMAQNPENIKLEKNIIILGEIGEVRAIVEICIKKAIHLKSLLEREGTMSLLNLEYTSSNLNPNLLNKSQSGKSILTQQERDFYFNEYKQSLYLILKLLHEIHLSIKFNNKSYESNAPDYIKNIFKNKNLTLEDKIHMRAQVIEEILKYDYKFLHDLLFDSLKSEDMLDDILKYDSPYIESYLSNQIEKEKSNPQRYEALYKFYLKSQNYSGALRILFNLINFDNSQIENGDKFVSLEDKRTYIKHLIYTLDHLIENVKNEEEKNFYLKNRNTVINMRDSYLIQADILLELKNLKEKLKSSKYENVIIQAIYDLDRNYYNLEDLYLNFAKKFKLYEIIFTIFFEMTSKGYEVDSKDVIENYDNFINHILGRNDFIWPYDLFNMLNKIFINLIETKTTYESFFNMLKINNYQNVLNKMIPLDYLVKKIENLNWNIIVKEKNIDFEKKSDEKFDSKDNPFWFVIYLKEVVNLPCFYLFNTYNQIFEQSSDETQILLLTMNIMQIIKMWCNNVEVFFMRLEKRDSRMPKLINDDYNEFVKIYPQLQDFLKRVYTSYSKNSTKIILEDESRKQVINFCKKIENKLESIINTNILVSKKKQNEPLNLYTEVKEKDKILPEEDDLFESKVKGNYTIQSNILDQCD